MKSIRTGAIWGLCALVLASGEVRAQYEPKEADTGFFLLGQPGEPSERLTQPAFRQTLAELRASEVKAGDALIAALAAAKTDQDRRDLEAMLKDLVAHLQRTGPVPPWYKIEHLRFKTPPEMSKTGGLEAEITVEDPDRRPPRTDTSDKQWKDPRILILIEPGKGWRAVVHSR